MRKLSFILWTVGLAYLFPLIASAQGGLDQRIADLSNQISKEMTLYQKATIAVVEFTDLQGRVTDLGRFLAEELITKLHLTRKFKVVERQLLNKALSEQALSLTGVIDPNSAKQLGRMLGVDAIASGTITDLTQSLKVNARLISTETGEVFAVASTEIFKDESVIRLMENGFANLSISTPKPKPIPTTRSTAFSGKGISPGMKFEFEDKVFEVQKRFRLRLVSIEFLEENVPKVNMTVETTYEKTSAYFLADAKIHTYVVDQTGEPYSFKEGIQLSDDPKKWKELPPGIPLKFSIVFAALPSTTEKLSLVVRMSQRRHGWIEGEPRFDCTFANVELRTR